MEMEIFDEDWLKLSIAVGSSSISQEQEKTMEKKESSEIEPRRQEVIKKRFMEFKKLETTMRVLKEPTEESSWLTLSFPGSSPFSSNLSIKRTRALLGIAKTLSLGRSTFPPVSPRNKKRPSSSKVPVSSPFKKQKISETTAQESRKAEVGWRRAANKMGLTHHEFLLVKKITKSDIEPNQHRLQLTRSDINNATQPLKNLAVEAFKSEREISVNVLDIKGNKYRMKFKYLGTSRTYRFMGRDYSKFLAGSELKAKQRMEIWGLRGDGGERSAEIWLSFVNSDEEEEEGDHYKQTKEIIRDGVIS